MEVNKDRLPQGRGNRAAKARIVPYSSTACPSSLAARWRIARIDLLPALSCMLTALIKAHQYPDSLIHQQFHFQCDHYALLPMPIQYHDFHAPYLNVAIGRHS